jgi:hypothetical protein
VFVFSVKIQIQLFYECIIQETLMIDTLDGWESVDNLAMALCLEARDFVLEGNFEAAEKQLRRAIAFDTYCIRAYEWLEYVLDAQERFDEACDLRDLKRRSMLEIALV